MSADTEYRFINSEIEPLVGTHIQNVCKMYANKKPLTSFTS
jgi:hypothetical protein